MAVRNARKLMKEYIIANGPVTNAQIMATGATTNATTKRCRILIDRWIANGKVVKSGDDHTWAV